MAIERTLVLIKPDAVARGLAGEIISRIERKSLRIVEGRIFRMDAEMAGRHYAEHRAKPFFGELVEFITSSALVALAVEGPDAISAVRALMGPTNPVEAPPGTIRGDFALNITQNLVHGSDSPESAQRELGLFFER
jgi:nucleoside-diphosphate kinase